MTFTPEIRKKCMQANKSKDTKPELILRKSLRDHNHAGYRLHWNIKGKPDICYPGRKVAVFVNGCFWHRCPHCNPPIPVTNAEYWASKFEKNKQRDKESKEFLESQGWVVVIVWECEIKNSLEDVTMKILSLIE